MNDFETMSLKELIQIELKIQDEILKRRKIRLANYISDLKDILNLIDKEFSDVFSITEDDFSAKYLFDTLLSAEEILVKEGLTSLQINVIIYL